MFHTFFPRPRLFFTSAMVWAIVCIGAWHAGLNHLADVLSFNRLSMLVTSGAEHNLGKEVAAHSLMGPGWKTAIWFYQYMILSFLLFAGAWVWLSPHRWGLWSVIGSSTVIFITWVQVELDVMINRWFGRFYDTVQNALTNPGNTSLGEFYGHLVSFAAIALAAVTISVLSSFLVSHYVFRWRTAMNDYYMANWQRLRHIEGASQRVQEDTKRFAAIAESLGVKFVEAIMTLSAFLPILWGLSSHITAFPLIGEVSQGLVFVALLWSIGGTVLLSVVGVRLPGLEFRNQRVEAAYRKELVLGEDNRDRATAPTVRDLFLDVRRNYFTLYVNYMYFNIVRYAYLQIGVLVPYVALAPTIVAGTITLGVMQQIIRAFNRVENSFQFLVNSWTVIVELLSIYKRLVAFSAVLDGEALAPIESEQAGGIFHETIETELLPQRRHLIMSDPECERHLATGDKA